MPKTIVFFLSDLQNGGTEWFAVHLARGLKKHGYRAVFLLSRTEGDLLPAIQQEFQVVSLNGHGYSPSGILPTIPALIRYLKTEKPDVLISGLPLINAAAGLATFLTGRQTKLIVVDHVRLCTAEPVNCTLKNWIKAKMVTATHHLAKYHVCVSQTVANDLRHYACPRCSPHVIYNPVIPEDFDELRSMQAQHPWIKNPKGPLLLSIGRLLEHKDYPVLLRAFQTVLSRHPDARLIILGEGDDRARLEQLSHELGIDQNISLPGAVTNVFPYLEAASLFVLPSRSEAFGNVIVEALACGIPIVSTDCGGPREILADGRYGRLVPVGSATEMAQAILESLTSQHNKEELMRVGRSFSVQKATEAYLKIIEN